MTHWKIILIQVFTIVAVRAFDLGFAWINDGEGLHPMLAGVIAMILLFVPHLVEQIIDEEY